MGNLVSSQVVNPTDISVDRKPGFYWVLMQSMKWEVASWENDSWWLAGNEAPWTDQMFNKIGPIIPNPE